jgi:probable O-glycosylation ligase (exosortase A-associated)
MRALLVALIVFGSLPFILRRPYIGILVWCWLSYMNPHRLAYGWAQIFNFAEIVAIATLLSMAMAKEGYRIPLTPLTLVWGVFIAWMGLTTYSAFVPEPAVSAYIKILKIQFTTFLTIMVMTDKHRLNLLLGVITLSIAFFGIKGGVFTLVGSGENRVWGPAGGFIEENNALGLALLMVLPLLHYLRSQVPKPWQKRALLTAMVLTGLAALGTYSRGAMIGATATLLFFFLKSESKVRAGVALVLIVPALVLFMPDKWVKRIETIFEPTHRSMAEWSEITGYDPPIASRDVFGFWPPDTSAVGRVNAWNYSVNVANASVTGGGLESWTDATFALYSPVPQDVHAAHSIYFSVLADHGWFGLFLFLLIGLLMWRNANWVIRRCDSLPEFKWLAQMCRMIQVGTVAYATGGAFLSLSYFDLFWHFVGITVIARRIVEQHLEKERQTNPRRPEQFGQVAVALPPGKHIRRGAP